MTMGPADVDLLQAAPVLVVITGIALIAAGRLCFKTRAMLNLRAWSGPTLPLLVMGVLLTAGGCLALWALSTNGPT